MIKKVLFCAVLLMHQLVFAQEEILDNNLDAFTGLSQLEFQEYRFDINNPAHQMKLMQLGIINSLQATALKDFIKAIGKIDNRYQLQAIPYFTKENIATIAPYLDFNQSQLSHITNKNTELWYRLKLGLQDKEGYKKDKYVGNRTSQLVRFRHNKGNYKLGFVADKDAGENFIDTPDYFSWFYHQKIRAGQFIIGDYDINLGQGLICWTGIAFGKSLHLTANRKVGSTVKPHSGSQEFNYFKGAAISKEWHRFKITSFVSAKKVDALLSEEENTIVSITKTGLHRTESELQKYKSSMLLNIGGQMQYQGKHLNTSLNVIQTTFDKRYEKLNATSQLSSSISYDGHLSNHNIYGEIAFEKNGGWAVNQGLIIAINQKWNWHLVYRKIQDTFKPIYGQSFRESSSGSESGIFQVLEYQAGKKFQMNGYLDFFRAHKFSSYTKESALSIAHKNNIGLWSARFTDRRDSRNLMQLRLELKKSLSEFASFRIRWEGNRDYNTLGTGSLVFLEWQQKAGKHSHNFRIASFNAKDFNNRIYSYERDVLYSYSIPAYYHQGIRCYVNESFKINRNTQFWLRIAHWVYFDQMEIGSGNETIVG
ncbi:MAG: hypothetical protein ACI8ZO_001254, partial [Flavobacteriales bacterium]